MSVIGSSAKFCPACAGVPSAISRRLVLAGSAAGGMGLLSASGARAQTALTPDAALAQLMAGNARYVTGKLQSFDEDLSILRQKTVAKQEPFAAVLSCADLRVPVELVFDQSIGHIFATRVAGNICTPEIIASLEYGAVVLGTAVIMVLGHADCGAVKAAIAAKPVRARSARFTRPCVRPWNVPVQTLPRRSRPMRRSRPACCGPRHR